MIIDAHVHIFPPQVTRDRSPHLKDEEQFALLYSDPKARLGLAEELLQAMVRDGVERSVVCGFPWSDQGRAREHNDYILDSAAASGGRLIPLACVDPSAPGGLAEAERALGRGAAGLGELGFYRSDLGQPEVHQALVRAAGLCAEADKPLLLHTNEPVGHTYPGKAPMGLKGLYEMVKACPRTRFQLAHLGGGVFFFELLKKEVREVLRNCVFDTAAAPFLYTPQVYSAFLDIAGQGRLLFGSDWPLLSLPRHLKDLDRAGLSQEERAAHLGADAALFWRV